MENLFIKRLREKQTIKLFDRTRKVFTAIVFNPVEKFVCWKRFESKDQRHWICINECLSLKDVCNIRGSIVRTNLEIV